MSVSRETTERLEAFEALVRRWNPVINLVSRPSLAGLRARHIADSAQIFHLAGITSGHWVDLGTGGGFPGIVVAILAAEIAPDLHVTCIEADQRKSAFLTTAVRELELKTRIFAQRIEAIQPQEADVVSARALAPLGRLLPLAERHLKGTGIALFPKGAGHGKEVDKARNDWRFTLESIPSQTDPDARILKLGEIRRE